MRYGCQSHTPAFYPRETEPVAIVYEVQWAPETVRTGEQYLAPSGFRSPDRPAYSDSLYRLSSLGPHIGCVGTNISGNILLPLLCTGCEMKEARSSYQNVRGYIIEVRSFETPKLYAADIECGNKFSDFDRNFLNSAAEQFWLVRL
jgi:hypothetical protein